MNGGAADVRGLTADEAAHRRAVDGANVLPSPPRVRTWRRLVAEMSHFFALLLWVAGGLAFVAGMPELGVAIFVVVVVNGTFAFVQEERAEHAAERLRDLLPRGVRVRRDGEEIEIAAADVVVGDVVLLGAGDRVPADVTVVRAIDLRIDEAMLSGESVPVAVASGGTGRAGTFVVNGEGEAVVVAIGSSTRLAEIAQLTARVRRRRSPLANEISRVVRTIAAIALVTGVSFFALALLVGTSARDGFLFGVGVTVALVPEGLLPTVTLSLAVGAQRMSAKQALVRHLEAVETLGSTTYVCTDKTGTLTMNEMSVVEVWTPAGTVRLIGNGYEPEGVVDGSGPAIEAAARAVAAARTCSRGRVVLREDGWSAAGDPMEAAVDAAHRRLLGTAALPEEPAIDSRHPFDPERRRESVVSGGRLLVKGAPESVLPRCRGAPARASSTVEQLAARGLRVIAVAHRRTVDGDLGAQVEGDVVEHDLTLLGVLAFEDPPRPDVVEALASCRAAGIRVAVLTGDHPTTARAIARRIELAGDGELSVLVGDDLPPDDAVLGALLDRDGVVLSRVSPEQKLRVASVLQQRGHVVAMTGDGVNDAPALRQADIGVAMGRSGTDVAREAADLVLLDDHFATIVDAIRQGRSTYANIRRFLTYHLTDNVAELTPFLVWALSGGRFPLALGVLQILCLDIGTDLLPSLALGGEEATPTVMRRPPERRHIIDRALLRRVFLVLGPTEAVVEMTAFVVALGAAGWRPGDSFPTGHALFAASGAAFAAVIVGQAANGFACRSSTRAPSSLGWTTNRLLLVATVVSAVLLAGFLVVAPLADLLDQAPPPAVAWPVILSAGPAVLAVDARHKRRRARHP